MIYIKNRPPHRNVSTKIAEIRRNPNWRTIPDMRPTDAKQQEGYGSTLRSYFDQLPKKEIRETLLEEQHGLCAYCMRRLSSPDDVKIEHWFPLSEARDTAIDYQNFLGSCDGIYSENQQPCSCCDKKKSGTIIKIDPRQQWMMDCIQYESNGTISFAAPDNMDSDTKKQIDRDINETLCLNGEESELTLHREKVYRSCKKTLKQLYLKNKCSVHNVEQLIRELEKMPQYPEYVGVMLFYYKRWLNNRT